MNDETSKLIAKVERFARQEQLFAPAEPGRALHLCAAVSGGADSMALLRVLLELREAFGYPLTACHSSARQMWEWLCRPMPGRTGPADSAMPALPNCWQAG